jgi:hypothetical protein
LKFRNLGLANGKTALKLSLREVGEKRPKPYINNEELKSGMTHKCPGAREIRGHQKKKKKNE